MATGSHLIVFVSEELNRAGRGRASVLGEKQMNQEQQMSHRVKKTLDKAKLAHSQSISELLQQGHMAQGDTAQKWTCFVRVVYTEHY